MKDILLNKFGTTAFLYFPKATLRIWAFIIDFQKFIDGSLTFPLQKIVTDQCPGFVNNSLGTTLLRKSSFSFPTKI